MMKVNLLKKQINSLLEHESISATHVEVVLYSFVTHKTDRA